jgi:hypothetical protein
LSLGNSFLTCALTSSPVFVSISSTLILSPI